MKHVRPNVSQFAAQWTQAQPITEPEKPKLKPRPRRRNRIPILETPDLPHEEREADENVSVEAVNDGKRAAENVACFVNDAAIAGMCGHIGRKSGRYVRIMGGSSRPDRLRRRLTAFHLHLDGKCQLKKRQQRTDRRCTHAGGCNRQATRCPRLIRNSI